MIAYVQVVAEEQLYIVDGATATPATRISLTEAGLREREHLQEWVLAHPEILGENVLVVTFEFDRWTTGAAMPRGSASTCSLSTMPAAW